MLYKSIGALHIHSKYSDGTATIEEIATSAKRAGLSWIIITDHNCLTGLKQEGWHDGVAVIVGEEISPDNSDHYLALNINQEISGSLPPEKFINEVKRRDGMGFIAHPDESLARKNKYRPLRWTDWNIQGFDGIEIWNYLSDWVDNYDPERILHCYLRRNYILSGPSAKTLGWWDRLNNQESGIIPAIGGVDAHALDYKFFKLNFKIFPYLDSFKTVANSLYLDLKLSNDFDTAKSQIYNALRAGNNVIINRCWSRKSSEFDFYIEGSSSQVFPGGTANLNDDIRVIVRAPEKANIRLIYNGARVIEHTGKELVYNDLKPGKYRVEVFYKDYPWIFTNPILVV